MYKKVVLSNKVITLPIQDEKSEMKFNMAHDLNKINETNNKIKTDIDKDINEVIENEINTTEKVDLPKDENNEEESKISNFFY